MSDTCDRPPPPRNADSAVGLLHENGLTAQLRSFEHHKPLRLDNDYPYRYPPDDNLVFYIEYRTCAGGPRLDIVALVGDVYLDMTAPDSPGFYFHDGDSWVQWNLDERRRNVQLCDHPFLTDVCLWASRAGLGWYPTHTIEADLRQYRVSSVFKSITRWMFREEDPTPQDRRIIRKRVRLGELEKEGTAAGLAAEGRAMKKCKVARKLRTNTSGSRRSTYRMESMSRSPSAPASSPPIDDREVQGFREVESIGQEGSLVAEKNSPLQAMIKSLQTENAKFKHDNRLSNTKFGTLAAELAKLEVSLRDANALATKFRDQITTLETQNRELQDNIQGAAADHTAAVAELVVKNTQIKTELQNMTERAATLEENINSLQADRQTFIAESRCKNEQLVAEVHSTQEQLVALYIENTRLQHDNKLILQKNVDVQAELQHAQAHNIEVQQDVQVELSSQGAIKEINGENKYLSMPVGELCLLAKRLEDESSKSNKTIQDLRNVQSNLKLELDAERKQRDEVAKRAKVAEAKLDDWMWRMKEMTSSHYKNDPSH